MMKNLASPNLLWACAVGSKVFSSLSLATMPELAIARLETYENFECPKIKKISSQKIEKFSFQYSQ